MAIKRIESKLP